MDGEKFDLRSLQQELKRKGMRWKAGKTKLSDLSKDEFRHYLGFRLPDEKSRTLMRGRIRRAVRAFKYPSAFDWRDYNNKNWTTPIRDQGSCGSCVAFGTVATMESQWKILKNDAGISIDLSEAHLFFCGGSCGCLFGWWVPPALTYAQDHGVSVESCFPYQDHDMECQLCGDWDKKAYRAVKWREIISAAERKSLISGHGPMIGCMDVYEDFKTYHGGIYAHTMGDKVGGHCISIVGYDDNQGCWICKNSWGTGWGESGGLSTEQGWFRIAYGDCGIDTDFPFYVIDDMAEGGIRDGESQAIAPCCLSAIAKGTPYEQDLSLLSEFKNTHLLDSLTAQKYIDLYYKYTEAFVEILRTDKRSKELAFALLDTAIEAIKSTGTTKEFILNEDTIKKARELLKRVISFAPSDLKRELTAYEEEIEELFSKGREKRITELTKIVQKHYAKKR